MDAATDPAPDTVGLVLGALGFGVLFGLGIQALVTWMVRGMPQVDPPSLTSGRALVLLLGTFGGILLAGLVTWRRLAPIANPWRQTMLAMIAGLGSFVVSLVTIPIDRGFGRPGLLGLAALAAAGCGWLVWRRKAAA
jgi:type IV secretory pathway TrbD component